VADNGKAGDAKTCGATANHEACEACCAGGPNTPAYKAQDDAFQKCVCDQAKSKCSADCAKTQCDEASGGPESTQEVNHACDSCNPDFTGCADLMVKACDADPTCAAAQKCIDDSGCDGKPAGPDEVVDGLPDGG